MPQILADFADIPAENFYPGVFTIGAPRCIIAVGSHPFLRKGEKYMKKTIAKKIYDTDTASVVKKVTSGYFGDPAGYEETLYITPDGSYFLYTNGGEASVHPTEEIKRMSKATAERWAAEN